MARPLSRGCKSGSGRRAFASVALLALLLGGALSSGAGPAAGRDLGSRLGRPGPDTLAESVPMERFVLPAAGPLAADGRGRLLLLLPMADGYDVLGWDPSQQNSGPASPFAPAQPGPEFALIYRRKGFVGTSLAVGPGGRFCVGLAAGVDCIDGHGRIIHHEHPLLTHIIAVALDGLGDLWALRSATGGTTNLQLVRLKPDASGEPVRLVSFRQSVQGFSGNSLIGAPQGGVFLPVIENDTHRVVYVDAQGELQRVADFWRLGGGIALARDGTVFVDGVKRPQSVQEQRDPVDVVLATAGPFGIFGSGPSPRQENIAAYFPVAPAGLGSRWTGHAALGGDGVLYVVREQPMRQEDGPATRRPVLWSVDTGRLSPLGAADTVIEFRIPYIDDAVNPRLSLSANFSPLNYGGPLFIARGQTLFVKGVNFTGKAGQGSVLIGGVPGVVGGWSEELIALTVPSDAPAGPAPVRVAIDHVTSDPVFVEVKTEDVPGWFQIGSPDMRAVLDGNVGISGYSAHIAITGVTEAGELVVRGETMATPGLYVARLPNGVYEVRFKAAYMVSDVRYGPNNEYVGSSHRAIAVPEQATVFEITDLDPVVVWMPAMLGE